MSFSKRFAVLLCIIGDAFLLGIQSFLFNVNFCFERVNSLLLTAYDNQVIVIEYFKLLGILSGQHRLLIICEVIKIT